MRTGLPCGLGEGVAAAEVDPVADDLVVAELCDAVAHHRVVVVADRALVDAEVVARRRSRAYADAPEMQPG
jgi:hypothetical protein